MGWQLYQADSRQECDVDQLIYNNNSHWFGISPEETVEDTNTGRYHNAQSFKIFEQISYVYMSPSYTS